jgi:omega-6 fatty acid desaturase (delta-12 desaturase)
VPKNQNSLDKSLNTCPVIANASAEVHSDTDPRIAVTGFLSPVLSISLCQIASSFGGFIGVCVAMYLLVDLSYWITIALALVAAGFLVRIFIIQHDCGHGSFFRSQRANHALGLLCSLLTLTPYANWRRQHAGHHGAWNNLDRRSSGVDIYSTCLTVEEYEALRPWHRRWYRLARHPLVANILLPPLIFLALYRVPFDTPKAWRRERRAVYMTDLVLVAVIVGLGFSVGFDRIAAVQLPVMVLASIIGVWLFSVQHCFEHTFWTRQDNWQFTDAALMGSSHLRLPKLLQWFTGNIGFHHIHHLNPRIPNYRLQECHDANPVLQTAPILTLWSGLWQGCFALWDEERGRMVSFKSARRRSRPTLASGYGSGERADGLQRLD